MPITIQNYNDSIYSTDHFDLRLIDTEVEVSDDIFLPAYNYAIIHVENGTIESTHQRYVEALSIIEQMEYLLRTESYKMNRPPHKPPTGGGANGGGTILTLKH